MGHYYSSMRQAILDFVSNKLGIELEHATEHKDLAELIVQLRPREVVGGLKRYGGSSDGAYLIPSSVTSLLDGCLSPGVGHTIAFESHLYNAFGLKTVLVDPSNEIIAQTLPDSIHLKHLLASVPSERSNSITLEQVINENFAMENNLVLQMDIEGSEYGVLLTAPESILKRFLVVIVEFHDLNRWKKRGLFEDLYKPALYNLLKTHVPVHLHPNSFSGYFRLSTSKIPRVLEVTLLRKDSPLLRDAFQSLPHPLDIDASSASNLQVNFNELVTKYSKV